MLFCPSFTQSERFLQTDQLIDKLHSHVDGKRYHERVQVRCSDMAGSDLPHALIDVRQISASVKVPGLCDEPLEELFFLWGSRQLADCRLAPPRYVVQVPSPRPA